MLPPHTSAQVTPPPHEHPPAVQSSQAICPRPEFQRLSRVLLSKARTAKADRGRIPPELRHEPIKTAIAHGTPHLDPALEEREERLDHSLRRRMGVARLKSDHLQVGERRRWLGRFSTHVSHPEGNPQAGCISG
jgi:hypothetical protein